MLRRVAREESLSTRWLLTDGLLALLYAYRGLLCSGKLSPMSNRREFFKGMAGATAGVVCTGRRIAILGGNAEGLP